jgi:hypothetical protein
MGNRVRRKKDLKTYDMPCYNNDWPNQGDCIYPIIMLLRMYLPEGTASY